MKHFTTPEFWFRYRRIPAPARELADKNFALLDADPRQPSGRLKKAGSCWPTRTGLHYRALARQQADGNLAWFWIGAHATYDHLA